ncbi:MAG: hypothetical protein U0K13_06250, partial [Oscillospiraceae bacterium]|nr:hypothetical protein [Oscillospiraceae bacterium]
TEKEQILCGAEARRCGHADAWQDGATKESVQNLPFTAHVFLCGVGQRRRFFAPFFWNVHNLFIDFAKETTIMMTF